MCEKWRLGLGKFYKMVRQADATHQVLWASTDDIEKYRLPFFEREDLSREFSLDEDESSAPPEVIEKVRAEMEALAMKAKTRLSQKEFEAKRKAAQEALKGEATR